jgi:transcription initiation factor TFIID subunit 1
MDLQTIKDNIRERIYHTRAEFQKHVQLILSNCVLYNGPKHKLTEIAQQMVDMCEKGLLEVRDRFTRTLGTEQCQCTT